jgi:two-component system phosphate regulon sensor histidine kinase PhoR
VHTRRSADKPASLESPTLYNLSGLPVAKPSQVQYHVRICSREREDGMLVLDLRWALFGVLVLALALAGGLAWLLDRRARRERASWPVPAQARPIFERAPFGLVLLERPETYHYANPYAQRLLGLTDPRGTLPSISWAEALAQDCAAALGPSSAAGRYRGVALDERFVQWWVTAWRADETSPPVFALFVLDATAQQRAERSARDLFSDLAHELRTPIATILTHLKVLRLPALSDEMRQQSLDLMQVEAQRMSRLSTALLDLGRLQVTGQIERRPVDLLPLVQEIVAQMRPRALEKDVDLTVESDAPLELVIGDASRLKQVFLNLLDNAIKYVRAGDHVGISLRQTPNVVRCTVFDDGPGIPAQHLPHITKRFYRGVPEGSGGSGLGLALVKEILQHHHSELSIESRTQGDQTGTQARFELPILPGDEEGT